MNIESKEILDTYSACLGQNWRNGFSWNSPVYWFSNENTAECISCMGNLHGKRVLAVAASGDQVFEAYLAGASRVDTFDINFLQRHVMELKQKMIQNLDYADFVRFWFDKDKPMRREIIRPIQKTFSRPLRAMLDIHYNIQPLDCRDGGARNQLHNWKNTYLTNEMKYRLLRCRLPEKIDFKNVALDAVVDTFNEKYDVILLSNIYLYYRPNHLCMHRAEDFYAKILQPMANRLLSDSGGRIYCNYGWRANLCTDRGIEQLAVLNRSPIVREFNRLNPDNVYHSFNKYVFQSACDKQDLDSIIVMHKNRNWLRARGAR